ncbi:PaaI family thioesterase [Oceanobacillus bengalensis]|uniref:PaaI family thioesterase n=1 Tax=Oceanobacillus bengalensis TaxID=1435466 RepID=A0A494YX03_9BACI|nr:PaaI family thioesterase [Oceanobacillus bengalensis]RKQ14751.1 PaaI family thioesterase [Oceanobacillus bengalensis]
MNRLEAKENFNHAIENEKAEFENFFLSKFFGLQFDYQEENCIVSLVSKDFMFNPQGSLHGGVIVFILDVSMGHLCKRHLGTAVTLEMNTQYLRPVGEGEIYCKSSFIKKGRKIIALKSDLFNEKGKLAATATATWLKAE